MSAGEQQQSTQDDAGSDPAPASKPEKPEPGAAHPVGEQQAAENRENESPA